MANVIGVRFENAGKLYFFDPAGTWPTPGDYVIVETARGVEFGEVVVGVHEITDENTEVSLKPVIRIATQEDLKHSEENKAHEKEAFAICQKKIGEHKLDMKLVSVEYTFDNSKILFYFTANGRVDFRSLVKDLASVFKTRIELRQIGVRDEAKMLGGLGPCGRPICCGAFLGDFQPVSIKMAKDQNLSLNPTKISGICGRLMCCLNYEEDTYDKIRRQMPKVGREVMTPDGPGVVWDLNVIKETIRVRIQKGDSSELRDYPMTDIQRSGVLARPQQEAPAAAEAAGVPAEPAAKDGEDTDEAVNEDASDLINDEAAAEPAGDTVLNDSDSELEAAPAEDRNAKPAENVRQNRPRPYSSSRPAPARREKVRPAAQSEKAAAPAAEAPQNEAAKAEPQPEAPKAAPAVSPWKKAVEEALKAARGETKAPADAAAAPETEQK